MRRILVEVARQKQQQKHGSDLRRQELMAGAIALPVPPEEILTVHETLGKLEAANQEAAELVKLRYFAGFTIPEAAKRWESLPEKQVKYGLAPRAWLATEISDEASE